MYFIYYLNEIWFKFDQGTFEPIYRACSLNGYTSNLEKPPLQWTLNWENLVRSYLLHFTLYSSHFFRYNNLVSPNRANSSCVGIISYLCFKVLYKSCRSSNFDFCMANSFAAKYDFLRNINNLSSISFLVGSVPCSF